MPRGKPKLTFADVMDGFKKRVTVAVGETPITVFVCGPHVKKLLKGGGRNKGAAIRYHVSKQLGRISCVYVWGEHKKLRSAAPKELNRYFSDAEKEIMFATDSVVDLVVIFPSSSGSLAELGAFALEDDIAKKMLIIFDDEHRGSKGFVVDGLMKSA